MSRHPRRLASLPLALLLGAGISSWTGVAAAELPVSPNQRGVAQKVAEAGVALSELAPNAPDSYTVKSGDTLWDISRLFLRSPWRWPELWGMNMEQIRNPHRIYPGQTLVLDKSDGRAKLVVAREVTVQDVLITEKLLPRIREKALVHDAISSIPMHLIGPFLSESVAFETDQLAYAPRIVATQEGRVMVSRGELAYVRGELSSSRSWQIYREPKAVLDLDSKDVLGYEARFVGVAEVLSLGDTPQNGKQETVQPSTIRITRLREEAGVGDRLAPVTSRETEAFAPHPPSQALSGRVVSVYGDSLSGGQNQIVAINRGLQDGVERGHTLALWRAGRRSMDSTSGDRAQLLMPDERNGLLFVFRVFERMSYALILQVQDPVTRGDRFSQP